MNDDSNNDPAPDPSPRSARNWKDPYEDDAAEERESGSEESGEQRGPGESGAGGPHEPGSRGSDESGPSDRGEPDPAAPDHPADPADPADPDADTPDPTAAMRRGGRGGLVSGEAHALDPDAVAAAQSWLAKYKEQDRGSLIGLGGMARHGKTALATVLRARGAQRLDVDAGEYAKTEAGQIKFYTVPGERQHVLVDTAGEDFGALGDYDQALPPLLTEFMWPVLPRLDGLILMVALPILWRGYNRSGGDPTTVEADEARSMERARQRMTQSLITLIKYVLIARHLDRSGTDVDASAPPERWEVDDLFKDEDVGRLDIPVAIGFSKADTYETRGPRKVLYAPTLPGGVSGSPPVHPERTDPMLLAHYHLPELFGFLMERVRFFKFDFVQVLEDLSERPHVDESEGATRDRVVGAEALLDFVVSPPWRLPGIDSRAAVRLHRRLHRDRWRVPEIGLAAPKPERETPA